MRDRLEDQYQLFEAVNGNIKALLRRGRGDRDMNYLLLKAQRLAATKTEIVVFQKDVCNVYFVRFSFRARLTGEIHTLLQTTPTH
jgi:hypothetical protein